MAELDRAGISLRMGQSREAAGLTQPEIADLMHVHYRSVQDWESARVNNVPFDRLGEWAELTSVSREWLLYGEESGAITLTPEMLERLEAVVGTLADEAHLLGEETRRLGEIADRLSPPRDDAAQS